MQTGSGRRRLGGTTGNPAPSLWSFLCCAVLVPVIPPKKVIHQVPVLPRFTPDTYQSGCAVREPLHVTESLALEELCCVQDEQEEESTVPWGALVLLMDCGEYTAFHPVKLWSASGVVGNPSRQTVCVTLCRLGELSWNR